MLIYEKITCKESTVRVSSLVSIKCNFKENCSKNLYMEYYRAFYSSELLIHPINFYVQSSDSYNKNWMEKHFS
jgi:hypothetical protein